MRTTTFRPFTTTGRTQTRIDFFPEAVYNTECLKEMRKTHFNISLKSQMRISVHTNGKERSARIPVLKALCRDRFTATSERLQ